MSHKDATGRPIEKGSYIAYAVTKGSRGGMNFGAVVQLKQKSSTRSVYDHTTKTYNQENYTVNKVQIITVHQSYIGVYPNGVKKWVVAAKQEGKLARVQTIDRLDRVIVLDGHQMNPEVKEALDKELHERGQL